MPRVAGFDSKLRRGAVLSAATCGWEVFPSFISDSVRLLMIAFISNRPWGAFFLCAFVVLAGCGAPQRATVKGKVTLGDKPLPVGNVMFTTKDNLTGTSVIDKDGNYAINDAPIGDVKISVSVPTLPPGGLEMMRRMKNNPGVKETQSVDPNDSSKRIGIMGDIPENIVPIPDKYKDAATSGLTYTVKGGEQTFDIKLTP
jgi:hypothetical protein